jgi:hypothetical protein
MGLCGSAGALGGSEASDFSFEVVGAGTDAVVAVLGCKDESLTPVIAHA